MKPLSDCQQESTPTTPSSSSRWNDRVLMAAVVVTMLLALLGYMHG